MFLFETRKIQFDICLFVFGRTLSFKALLKQMVLDWDQVRFLGNYPPTPPLSQHFALNEK